MSENSPHHQVSSRSLFIAFAGVMGVGKSSLARALAKQLGGRYFIEPEADAWPVPEGEKWEDHVMQLEKWVHDTNLSLFQQAMSSAESGVTSVADGGLFVLAKEYMDDPACEFYYDLLSADEMQQLRETACADWHEAPCPDVLVLVETDLKMWKRMLQKRGRIMDANPSFIASYHEQQRAIRAAAETYAREKKINMIRFNNTWMDIDKNAHQLAKDILALRG
jgi:deoxyadenosine/deoxycytidine kinase